MVGKRNNISKFKGRMEEDSAVRRPQVTWDKGKKMMMVLTKLRARGIRSVDSKEYNKKKNVVTKCYKKKFDDFLPVLNSVFYKARYFGVSGFGVTFAFAWCLMLFVMLVVTECIALWRIITLLGGWRKQSSNIGLIGRLSGVIFYANAVLSLFLSSKFVHSWRNLSTYWLNMENNTALDFPPDVRIKKRTIFVTVFVATFAVVGLIGRLSGVIFYANAVLSLFLSSKFVHSWRNLSTYWLNMENNTALDFPPDVRIKKRTIFVTVFVATFAVVEHALSMVSATGIGFPPEEFFYRYITLSHGFLFKKQDYSLWSAIPLFILSKLATALWNFQDLIIILISMGLTSRYHRLNLYVNRVITTEKRFENKQKFGTDLYLQIQVWRRLREAYVRQSTLVRMVDRHIGSLVLLSNVNNLYFICLQIYLGIHKDSGSLINHFYFLFSLSWLIFRACGVVLAASDVHLHSQRALKCLHTYPSASYNIEMKRLQYQLAHDFVALTGKGFFSLRRELLLEVAAAILKYELVLIQYDN